jgi:hyperosmotically inducible protein
MRASIIAIGVAFAVLTSSGCTVTRNAQTANVHIDDKAITSTIKARHAESKDVAITSISVETLYGVVLLSGVAKNLEEKMTAENIAGQVDGVKAVHNEILIQP